MQLLLSDQKDIETDKKNAICIKETGYLKYPFLMVDHGFIFQ